MRFEGYNFQVNFAYDDFLQKKEKNKLLDKLRAYQKSVLEAQNQLEQYKICGAGFKMKC